MLRFALIDDIRTEPVRGGRGICPTCGGNVIAKCGQIKTHHWAHESKDDCDTWSEPIGPWHLSWQNIVRSEFVEVPMAPHRADILGDDNLVIELQHSPIGPEEIEQRESFYKNMVWVFDATHRFSGIHSGERFFFWFGRTKHITVCKKPLFLDFGDYIVDVEAVTDELSQFSGFGIVRDREWFVRSHLASRRKAEPLASPIKSKATSAQSWPAKLPWRFTRFPSRWRCKGIDRVLRKGSLYIPLNYVWKNRRDNRKWPVWAGVISKHPELANGWSESEFSEMKQFLKGEPMILDGHLRLMPAPADRIPVTLSTAAARATLRKVVEHADAGRIAVLKDETHELLLERAAQYEIGHLRDLPVQNPRSRDRRLFD